MPNLLARYTQWLHTRWPAGTAERLPQIGAGGETAIPGVRVVGDLTGIPLLKLSADGGAKAARIAAVEVARIAAAEVARLAAVEVARIAAVEVGRAAPAGLARERDGGDPAVLDLAIVGGGVAGIAAALEAKSLGLRFAVFEAAEPFSTVANFPKGKPIYTYPAGMTPEGRLRFRDEVHPKEALLESLEGQRRAAGVEPVVSRIERIERAGSLLRVHHADGRPATEARRVIVAIGRSGSHRRLGVPGEDSGKVFNRLYDPKEFAGARALVVGGGDSAVETAIALASCGARVTLCCRGKELVRPKPANLAMLRSLERDPGAPVEIEHPTSEQLTSATGPFLAFRHPDGAVVTAFETRVVAIEPERVVLRDDASGTEREIENDVVFTMIGRKAPLDFFRRSGIPIRGEWTLRRGAAFAAFLAFCVFLYNWKAGGAVTRWFEARGLFPFDLPAAPANPATLAGTLAISLREPGFYYAFAYCLAVVLFGIARVRRRRTPYVARQTIALAAIQVVPLFLLPYVLLPWWGHAGAFDSGFGRTVADHLFPAVSYGQGREYWRAFGLILAWPLFVWNVFSPRPMAWWLAIAFLQTFVAIPLIVRRWGKGAYCGWICSCGALAETMGDAHREKMPHGPLWNRLNMTGQAILAAAFLLFAGRAVSWAAPGTRVGAAAGRFYDGMLSGWAPFGVPVNYARVVDLFLAGIVGVGFYFWFSGRVWCRFACPLAALMHIYARFSRFRIFPEKAKCISCNVCTSVCHQGIDVMSFANKGVPMEDPQCVRCSACVQMCPTGVLSFGRVGAGGLPVLDRLPASPIRMAEANRPANG